MSISPNPSLLLNKRKGLPMIYFFHSELWKAIVHDEPMMNES